MSNGKNPVKPKGYDKEEAWAHEQNQKAIEEMRKKREAEEAKGDDDGDDEPGLHHYAYGKHADPDHED